MKRTVLFIFLSLLCTKYSAQLKNVNKLTLETTYSYVEIHKTLRDLIDKTDRSSYFDDDFFNALLKKIILDKQFSDKEKVHLFYLMQKKLGFSFVGVSYIPPRQNYFSFFSGQVRTWQKTGAALKELNYNPSGFLALVDAESKKNVLVASNALLLATLLNPDSSLKAMERWSRGEMIQASSNPAIFNHYVCMSAAVKQSTVVTANLLQDVKEFKSEQMIEDVLCALYSKNTPLSTIKEYVLAEQNPQNDLAIQTAICALAVKVPPATFKKSLKSFMDESKEKWKKELLKNMLSKKIPFNYNLSSNEWLVNKTGEEVVVSTYAEGTLITNGAILEFDPN